jgi:hypothetical protein
MGQPIDSHPATQPHKAALTGAVRITRDAAIAVLRSPQIAFARTK